MPSLFPGMDPYTEQQEWADFHHKAIELISQQLMSQISPQYVARAERRLYVEHALPPDEHETIVADGAVVKGIGKRGKSSAALAELAVGGVECAIPMPEEHRESYLVLRERETLEVVTVIELLSPNNKRGGSDGRREYLMKREEVLRSQTNLVEIDLLRGGKRMPLLGKIPVGDYYAVVSREFRRPKVQVFAWSLRQACPAIPVPLRRGDKDATLDLQAVVGLAYERARYDLTLDYRAPLAPRPASDDRRWLETLLAKRR